MLICLGGFLGSGRRILAKKLAAKLGYYYYDIDEKKLHDTRVSLVRRPKVKRIHPGTDEQQVALYDQVLREFPRLSKMYPNVVVQDSFHRAKPREYFFSAARRSFDRIVFVWVGSDEKFVEDRLMHMREIGIIHNVHRTYARREREIAEFEPFSESPLTFNHTISSDDAAARLVELVSNAQMPTKK